MTERQSNVYGLGELITETLKRYHLDKRARQELAAADWPAVVGEKAAKASQPDVVRDGICLSIARAPSGRRS